ncbi:unnamed protein product [Brassica oleracea]
MNRRWTRNSDRFLGQSHVGSRVGAIEEVFSKVLKLVKSKAFLNWVMMCCK